MKRILKTIMLLVPGLAIASSLSGTPPYTAISEVTYQVPSSNGGWTPKTAVIVTDSVGNILISTKDGHDFGQAIASGCSVGASFITPGKRFSSNSGATLWYKNTSTCMPVQLTNSYILKTHNSVWSVAPNSNAPSMVSGVLEQVVGVNGIDSSYPNSGGVALSVSKKGNSLLNYYELNGNNNYTFGFFRHLSKSHIAANRVILASAGPLNLDVRSLTTGNNNSYMLPRRCQNNRLFSGSIKFMYAGLNNIYLICNKKGNFPNQAMLYRFNNTSSSFDAGQRFNPTDNLYAGQENYKAASSRDGIVPQNGVVFLEESINGQISYINTCNEGKPLASCQSAKISGITNVDLISGGAITDRFDDSSGLHKGYAALFVGVSNMIFKVVLDKNGNYLRYTTY